MGISGDRKRLKFELVFHPKVVNQQGILFSFSFLASWLFSLYAGWLSLPRFSSYWLWVSSYHSLRFSDGLVATAQGEQSASDRMPGDALWDPGMGGGVGGGEGGGEGGGGLSVFR